MEEEEQVSGKLRQLGERGNCADGGEYIGTYVPCEAREGFGKLSQT